MRIWACGASGHQLKGIRGRKRCFPRVIGAPTRRRHSPPVSHRRHASLTTNNRTARRVVTGALFENTRDATTSGVSAAFRQPRAGSAPFCILIAKGAFRADPVATRKAGAVAAVRSRGTCGSISVALSRGIGVAPRTFAAYRIRAVGVLGFRIGSAAAAETQ